ncbi:rhodanese-like domain-containing protein [Paenibacillus turpanensis]|uniref:rhodanese-like domain-containing protein n=1 Tax=Paenibacillus turpanensis TaxID=2689078 RepID=UPI00140E5956|nr:rhodanese-like domain-containing protein [Paenibacillus turpanensis]
MSITAVIHPEQFIRKLEAGELKEAVVIDVREQVEWDYYHIEPATLIPLQSLPFRLNELPEEKTIFFICAHGVRSRMACDYVKERGYDVVNVEGGMAAVAAVKGFAYD